MDNPIPPPQPQKFPSRKVIHLALQLFALAFLLVWCIQIIAPFAYPVLWAAILAVTLYPIFLRLKKLLGGRKGWSAVLVSGILFLLFVGSAVWLTLKTADEVKTGIIAYKQGKIMVPPPPPKVKDWPVIGRSLDQIWRQTSVGMDTLISKYPSQVKSVTGKAVDLLASTGKGLLILAASIIISGIFLYYAEESANFARILFQRIIEGTHVDMASLTAITIRNVVKGILGVALIQSLFATVGMIIAGVPYAGIWGLACLILAIVQIGILPVSIGIIIYIWSAGTTGIAIFLTIWMAVAGFMDNILKPLLMGKGAPVPMLVIFLGSLGGFILSGFIGLFLGAVVLSLGYQLFDVWLKQREL
jgi:predicted PurR-regulated permease PerM